jgi:hypothetical protein
MSDEPLALPPGAGIRDEEVSASAPQIRALVVQRLEMIWRNCEPHINVPVDEDGNPAWKADPRFIEAGIRVTDRLTKLFRLDEPQVAVNAPDPESITAAREVARRQITELGERMTEDS